MSIIAFYTGASGMMAYQRALDVSANNIANVNTTGFKASRPSFQDLIYSRINTNVEGNYLVGHGIKVRSVDLLMGQASLDQTNVALDFAIVGDGFFEVEKNGQLEYTRNGAFDLSVNGDTATLVDGEGSYVLDRGGNRINLTRNDDGSFSTDDLTDRIGIYAFDNPYDLTPQGSTNYLPNDKTGPATLVIPGDPNAAKPLELLQGALEYSGTDLGSEMVKVIASQRAFQLSSRVLQTADQIAEEINNLR